MNRLNLSPRNWRMATTLFLSVVILFGFLLSVALLSYNAILRDRRAAELENAAIIARNMASRVERLRSDIESTTFAAALFFGSVPNLDQEYTGPYLTAVRDQHDVLRALFITDLSGVIVASAEAEGIGIPLAGRPYMESLRQGARTVWSDGLLGLQSGEVTVAFGRPVTGTDGRARGFLIAALYPLRVTARLQASVPRDASVTLFDRRGFILSTTYPVRLSPAQRAEPPIAVVREALAGRPVRFIGKGLSFQREDRYSAIVPIPRTQWALKYGRPLAPLEAHLRRQLVQQMAAVGAAALLAIVLFLLILRRIIRPLETLARAAGAIARGERPQVHVPEGAVETRELAAGFGAMASSIAQREDDLRAALENEQSARAAAERAQERLAFLTEASTLLASSLDLDETLGGVAQIAVPRFADWAAVDVLDEDGRVNRVAIAHVDPAKVKFARELQRRYPPDPAAPRGVYHVLRTGQTELYQEIPDTMLVAAARDEEHLRLIREVGLTSAVSVPILIRHEVVGAISFVWAESKRVYTPEDVQLARDLARRAASAIENARLYQQARSIAETLQRSLLLKDLPELPGLSIAARYLPARREAEVGGDWYDAFVLPDNRLGLVMGDVAGRGVEAAAVMGQIQYALRAYAMEGHGPAAVFERLNQVVEVRGMATVFYAVLDATHWTLTYANAGHLPALVRSPDGAVAFLEEGGSLPLGGALGAAYLEATHQITPGSTLILFTDGLVETRGESIDERLDHLLHSSREDHGGRPGELLDHLITSMLGGKAATDDVALLAVQADALDAAHVALQFPAVPAALPRLRHTLRRWLEQAGISPAEVFEITVAVSEAFSNAVEHAYGASDAAVEVDARLTDGDLRVQVQDWGRWRAPRGTHRGRGLGLMRGLMDDVDVTAGETGTLVSMRRRLRREVPV